MRFALVAVLLLSSAAVSAQPLPADLAALHRIIAQIQTESGTTRYELSVGLAGLVRQTPKVEELDDETIGRITGLLNGPDNSVTAWVATALGFIGPRARAAVPALEEALARIEGRESAFYPDPTRFKTNAGVIRDALDRIRSTPPG
jgi:hypothetical protein